MTYAVENDLKSHSFLPSFRQVEVLSELERDSGNINGHVSLVVPGTKLFKATQNPKPSFLPSDT